MESLQYRSAALKDKFGFTLADTMEFEDVKNFTETELNSFENENPKIFEYIIYTIHT